MKRLLPILAEAYIFFYGCRLALAQLSIEPAFPNLVFEQPVDIQYPDDSTNRLFVVSQAGKIYVFDNNPNTASAKIFLDLTDKVLFGGEQGLLGLAFDPDYKTNGYFYVNYTTDNPRRSIISRFQVSISDPNSADKNSEQILLEVNQPYSNHNGGQIRFGPDSYLYISLGDGGSGGDPQNNAQNLHSLLGKILRIDVNDKTENLNYGIPEDNPFVANSAGYLKEIYAYGLRNVWRFSFDKVNGILWAADVGQYAWEEIDIIKKGKNYGWNVMEGFNCYNPSSGCDTSGLTLPIWEYGHNQQGGFSITGGFVYRGKNAQEIYGKYIYGDFVSGNIWSLEYNGCSANNSLLFQSTGYNISTFGVDQNNELYFADYSSGKIYKIIFLPNMVTDSKTLTSEFELKQNYPNPFNPATSIEYVVGSSEHVMLKVYDVLGREVATLVDKYQSAGKYKIIFDAAHAEHGRSMTSGIYFYSLYSGNYTNTKKILLLK